MNNKGFTLIELLATIVLLGVIASISFVSITAAINKGKISTCKSIQDSIKSAMIEYVSDNRYKNSFVDLGYDETNKTKTVDAGDLIGKNYLSEITNPFDKTLVSDNTAIEITAELNDDFTVKNISIHSGTYTWIELYKDGANLVNGCEK